jgi:hypothetical protein
MDELNISYSQANGNGEMRVCPGPDCIHAGEPQPAKRFNGRDGVVHPHCRDCRWGPRDRRKTGDEGLNGYGPPKRGKFVLPPGCEVLELRRVPGLAAEAHRHRNGCEPGLGLTVLTDPMGRPVVKRFKGLKPGEVCYIIR